MTSMRDDWPWPAPGAPRWLWLAGGRLQGVGRTREASLNDALNRYRTRYDTDPMMSPWELEDAEGELRAGQGLEMTLQGTTRDIQVVWGHLLSALVSAWRAPPVSTCSLELLDEAASGDRAGSSERRAS